MQMNHTFLMKCTWRFALKCCSFSAKSVSVAPLLLADVTTVQMSVVLLAISIWWICRCLFLRLRPRCPSFLSSYNLSSVPSLITPVNYTVFPQTKWIWSLMTLHYLPQKIRGGGNQLSVPPAAASPSFSTLDSCDITGSPLSRHAHIHT